MRRVEDLSLQELEALVLQKRRHICESAVMRMASAERAVGYPRPTWDGHGRPVATPARAPETWRGAYGQDRYLRSFVLLPLTDDGARAPGWPAAWPRLRDVLLLALEIAALLGFIALLGAYYQQLRGLNDAARAVQRAALALTASPTAEATQGVGGLSGDAVAPTVTSSLTGAVPTAQNTPTRAVITASLPVQAETVLTPSGTAWPTDAPDRVLPGGESPSRTGTPRSAVSDATPSATPLAAAPTPGARASRRLVIATLGVEAPIVEGDSVEQLKKGIGHRAGSANPGERGNVVLAAHNDAYGEIFKDLHKLKSGDEVQVHFDGRVFRYIVRKMEIVLPTRVEVMDPTNTPVLTLITCYPYMIDTHRVVVVADLVPQ